MSDTKQDKSPVETANELKAMLTDYARQETVGPLKLLSKWVAFGVAGAILIAIGVCYLAFALLRGLQEIDTFESNGGSFWPYLIAFGALLVCMIAAGLAAKRTFDEPGQ